MLLFWFAVASSPPVELNATASGYGPVLALPAVACVTGVSCPDPSTVNTDTVLAFAFAVASSPPLGLNATESGVDPVLALAAVQTEDGDATAIRPYEDERMIVNMSVWESIEALRAFVYSSGHTSVMRNRKQWFEKLETYLVLWWVPVGHEPTIEEAKQRLEHLERRGPTPDAFTFRASFAPPDAACDAPLIDDEVGCPA